MNKLREYFGSIVKNANIYPYFMGITIPFSIINTQMGGTESFYYKKISEYCSSDITKIVIDYLIDIPVGYKFMNKFDTNRPISFAIDTKYIYVLSDNEIRKYKLYDRKLEHNWIIDSGIESEFYAYDIAVSNKWIAHADYMNNNIKIFTKDGKLNNKFNYDGYNINNILVRLNPICISSFLYSCKISITDEIICISIFNNLMCFDINGNKKLDKMYESIISDIIINGSELYVLQWNRVYIINLNNTVFEPNIIVDKLDLHVSFPYKVIQLGIWNNNFIRYDNLRGYIIFKKNDLNVIHEESSDYVILGRKNVIARLTPHDQIVNFKKLLIINNQIFMLVNTYGLINGDYDKLEIRIYDFLF